MDFINSKEIKKFIPILYATLIVFLIFLVFQTFNTIKKYNNIGNETYPQSTVSVNGEGELFEKPDIAHLTFSVVESAKTASEAQELANDKINKVFESLKELGIEENDIKTSDYNLYPKYEYQNGICTALVCRPGTQILTGYEISHSVSVKIRNIDDAGKILSSVGTLGVSNISNLSFSIENKDELMRQAREIAIKDAKSKAKALAKDLDVKLVKIVSFYESGNDYYYDMPTMNVRSEAAMGGDNISIMTGENKILSRVNITYEIR